MRLSSFFYLSQKSSYGPWLGKNESRSLNVYIQRHIWFSPGNMDRAESIMDLSIRRFLGNRSGFWIVNSVDWSETPYSHDFIAIFFMIGYSIRLVRKNWEKKRVARQQIKTENPPRNITLNGPCSVKQSIIFVSSISSEKVGWEKCTSVTMRSFNVKWPWNPFAGDTLQYLAESLFLQGKKTEACDCVEWSVRSCYENWGWFHPRTKESVALLLQIFAASDRTDEAESILKSMGLTAEGNALIQ